ncbi:hypothetical protein JOC73_001521 [Alkaliphilus hydrothermalis]|uniref:Uncharacterized protein n=1 Tax=Alkaliphilus hydrothermalis TaxID=1482730 RepID=A0ABS2NPZ2_9FIRM|nr:hypothetical protein [Alkaliphilus hydrothermalis]
MTPSVEMGKPQTVEKFLLYEREGVKIYINRNLFISNDLLSRLINNFTSEN